MGLFVFRDRSSPDVTHWAGYLDFLTNRYVPFHMVSVSRLQAMTTTERLAYDSARLNYLSEDVVVPNETVVNLTKVLEIVMGLNRGKPKGGYGVIASAPSGRGKTTALHFVLRKVFMDYLKQDPDCITENRCCPVAYICIPDSGTPKSIYMEIADYLGVEFKPRDSDPVMRKMVLTGIANAGIQVFVIDEVQNLENGGSYARRAADAVRRLADDTAATFILAGINVERTSIMEGARGLQISNRFLRVEVAEYGKESPGWMMHWKGLVGAMADALPLYGTSRSGLQRASTQLHEMCDGSVQAFNLMLTQAAHQLIELGDHTQETVTLDRLQDVRFNLATEQHMKAELEKTTKKASRIKKPSKKGRKPPAADGTKDGV
jgi:hypothetical protein